MLNLLVSLILIVATIAPCSAAPSSSTATRSGDPPPAKAGDALSDGMQVGSVSLQPPDGILNLPKTARLLAPKATAVPGNATGLVTQIPPGNNLSPQSQSSPGGTTFLGVSSITGATGTLSSLSTTATTTSTLNSVTGWLTERWVERHSPSGYRR